MNEWMNECLTTPQHEKQIGYWVSEKGLNSAVKTFYQGFSQHQEYNYLYKIIKN